jgi:hypothetical protein
MQEGPYCPRPFLFSKKQRLHFFLNHNAKLCKGHQFVPVLFGIKFMIFFGDDQNDICLFHFIKLIAANSLFHGGQIFGSDPVRFIQYLSPSVLASGFRPEENQPVFGKAGVGVFFVAWKNEIGFFVPFRFARMGERKVPFFENVMKVVFERLTGPAFSSVQCGIRKP